MDAVLSGPRLPDSELPVVIGKALPQTPHHYLWRIYSSFRAAPCGNSLEWFSLVSGTLPHVSSFSQSTTPNARCPSEIRLRSRHGAGYPSHPPSCYLTMICSTFFFGGNCLLFASHPHLPPWCPTTDAWVVQSHQPKTHPDGPVRSSRVYGATP